MVFMSYQACFAQLLACAFSQSLSDSGIPRFRNSHVFRHTLPLQFLRLVVISIIREKFLRVRERCVNFLIVFSHNISFPKTFVFLWLICF